VFQKRGANHRAKNRIGLGGTGQLEDMMERGGKHRWVWT